MTTNRAFYSVVQYCPDRFRAEAVNVGLVLYCENPRFLRAKIVDNHRRLKRIFGVSGKPLADLRISEQNLLHRINERGDDIATLNDLNAYVATRANDIRLTEPRVAMVADFEADFARLFAKLAANDPGGSLPKDAPAQILPPAMSEVFYRLSQEGKIWNPKPVVVPVFNRKLDVPYAFRNGAINLVQPYVFQPGKRADNRAAALAIDGDLISRHLIGGEQHKLIVVSTQETPQQAREIDEHIHPLFKEYNVRLIRPNDDAAFAKEVQGIAH